MDIRQLSIHYNVDHDRILVRVNTSAGDEVQMWLTRRLVLGLWPLLNRVVIDHLAIPADAKTDGFVDLAAMEPGTRKMLADMRQQEAVQSADFVTPYRNDATNRPLGETPLLVTEVNLTPKGSGLMLMNFKEVLTEPASSRGFQLDLPAELVFAIMQLLSQALEQAQWQTGHGAAAPLPVVEAVAEEIDLSPDATRPTYLN
jgi:hypothetical protein